MTESGRRWTRALAAARITGAGAALSLLLAARTDAATDAPLLIGALAAMILGETCGWIGARAPRRRDPMTALAGRLAPALAFLGLAAQGWAPFWMAMAATGLGVLAAHLRPWFGAGAAVAGPAGGPRRIALGLAPAAALAAHLVWPDPSPPELAQAVFAALALALLSALAEPLATARRLPVPERRRLRLLLEAFAPDSRGGALRLLGLLLGPAAMLLLSLGAAPMAAPAMVLAAMGEALAFWLARLERGTGHAKLRGMVDASLDSLRHVSVFIGLSAAGWAPLWLTAALIGCETAAAVFRADPPARPVVARRLIYLATQLGLVAIGLGKAGAAAAAAPILLALALLSGLHLLAESTRPRLA